MHPSSTKATVRRATLALLLLAAGCTRSTPIKVKSYWGATTERVPARSTYDWADPSGQAEMAAADPQLYGLVGRLIEEEMKSIGYRRAPGRPDFLVSYSVGTDVQPTAAGQATLGLLAIQAASPDGRLIWRGWAEGKVDPSHPPEERRATIENAVHRVLAEFAP